jgi:hypothetical protein
MAPPIPPTPAALESIAGTARLDEVLTCLRARRPVFHSEADPQHSFALVVDEVAPKVRCRLEVPVRGRDASEGAPVAPGEHSMPTRDEEFRIHDGRELSGTLLWAGGSFRATPGAPRHLQARLAPVRAAGGPRRRVPLPHGVRHSEPGAGPAAPRRVNGSRPVHRPAGARVA